ncbi:MAG: sensor histidine kinase [Armatimonadota bacterium]
MAGSIRLKLTVTYLLVVLFSMGLLGANLPFLAERRYTAALEKELRAHAAPLRSRLEEALYHGASKDRLDALCDEIAGRTGTGVAVLDIHGRVVVRTVSDPKALLPVPTHATASKACTFCHTPQANPGQLVVDIPLRHEEHKLGILRLLPPLGPIRRVSDTVRTATMVASIVAAVLASIAGMGLAAKIARPIARMNLMAAELARGNLDVRLEVSSRDEIGELAQSLNTMARSLKQMIAELAVEKERSSAVLQGMAEGIVAVSRQGQVLLVNRAAEVMFGIPAEYTVGKPAASLPNVREFWPLFQQCLQTGKPLNVQFDVRGRGSKVLSVHVYPLRALIPEEAGAMAVFRDLTELRRTEESRRRFLADVSHEMRTPVAGIKGTAEVLKSGAADDPTARDRFLSALVREADRLSSLLDNLLELERIDAGQLSLRLEPVHLRSLAEEVAEDLGHRASEKNLVLTVDVPDHLYISADVAKIERVLLNLLDNAIKYTEQGGRVSVSAQPEGNRVRISVVDTGIGIPPEDLPHVFDRFYRVDKARSRRMGGSGLGLAIVREIVEAHGGSVSVESKLGLGSVFSVELPAAGPQKDA